MISSVTKVFFMDNDCPIQYDYVNILSGEEDELLIFLSIWLLDS